MTKTKKILIGLGIAFVVLIAISAALNDNKTDTSSDSTTTVTESEPATITSLAGCRVVDSIRCEVYHKLFPNISAVYFPDMSVEFTDADFDWVDCVAFVASEHIFLDSNQSLVEGAIQDGLNACGSAP